MWSIMRQCGMVLLVALMIFTLAGAPAWADTLQQGASIRPVQKIWMSDKQNGDPIDVFPSGLKKLYVVFDYKDAADVEIQVRVLDPKGGTLFLESKKYSGAGRENLEVTASDPLVDGSYVTNVYVGLQGNLFLSESSEWNIGKPPAPKPQPTGAAPPAPAQAQQAAAPNAPQPQAPNQAAAAPAQPAVVSNDPGVSAPMLIGAGILIVGLLALVVWAVRGFLSAPKASA